MAKLVHANSTTMYSWWWNSHISPKNSKWLQENLTDMDKNVKAMIKLIEEDADSFRKRAEMYYRKRPELMKLVEEFYRAYRALAERYDHATGALRQAHRTMAEAFPDQIPLVLPDESPSGSSGIDFEPPSPEMLQFNDALDGSSLSHVTKRNGLFYEEDDVEVSQLSEENQRLKNQIISESERADNAQADVDSLKGTVSKLESEKESALLQYQISQERISSLQAELSRTEEDLKKHNNELLLNITNLSEENQRLKNLITSESQRADNAQADIDSLKSSISKLESAKEAAFLQCKLFRDRISSLQVELSRTEADSKKLNDEFSLNINKLLEENQRLKNKITSESERADNAQADVDSLKGTISKLELEKDDALLQYQLSQERISSLQAELSRTEEDLKKHNNELLLNITNLSEENQRLKSQITSESQRADNAQADVDCLRGRISKLESDKKSAFLQCQMFRDRISSLQAELSRNEEDLKKLNKEFLSKTSNLSEENQRLKNKITSELKRADNAQADIDSLKDAISKLESDKEAAFLQRQLFQDRISSLEAELSRSEADSKKLNDEFLLNINILSEENQRLKNRIASESQRADTAQADVDRLKASISKLESDKESAILQCQLFRDRISRLEAELSQTQEDLKKLNDEFLLNNNIFSEENQRLKNRIFSESQRADAAQTDIDSLKATISKLESDKESALLQCQQSRDRISSLETELSRTQEVLKKVNNEFSLNTNIFSEESRRLNSQITSESQRADAAQAHVDSLNASISKLESDKESAFLQCQLFRNRISRLEAELSRTQEDLKKVNDEFSLNRNIFSEENRKLKNRITSESQRADTAQADVDSLKASISKLESDKESAFLQCQLSRDRISSLEAELSHTQEDLKKVNDEILLNTNIFSEEIRRLTNRIASESQRADTAQADVDSLKASISKLESDKESAFLQCQLFRDQISHLEAELSRTQEDLKKVNDEFSLNTNIFLEENRRLKDRITTESQRADTAQADLDSLKASISKLESDKESAFIQCQLSGHRISSLEAELSRTQEDLKKVNNEFSLNTNIFLEENRRLKSRITSESERADSAQADVHILKSTISKLESDKESALLQCQLFQDRISGLESELSRTQEDLKKHCDQTLLKITNLSEESKKLMNQITSESVRADNALADVYSLKGAISILESDKEAAVLHGQLSQERISSLEAELSHTQKGLKKLNDELLLNITNLKSVEEQCSLLQEGNQALQFELDIFKEIAMTKQAELDMLLEELENLKVAFKDEKQRNMHIEMAYLSLEELHSRSQEEVRHLSSVVKNGVEELKNMELTKAGLEEELQRLKEENGSLKEENFSFSLKTMNLQDEIGTLNESKRKLEDEIEYNVEENGILKEENFSSSLKIMVLQDEISSIKESKKRLEDEITSMSEEKKHLEQRYIELTQQIGALNLNVESLQALIRELRDGNVELRQMCKMHEDEKAVHLANLKRLGKTTEKNAILEDSLSHANTELEELREKVKTFEESCESLRGKISMHVSDKAILVSQIVGIAQNMGKLSEKNAMLEISLSDANVELEGLRGKLKSLEDSYQSLHDKESNLLLEKSTLVTQVENISQRLENSESGYAEFKCKNMNLEKEKENMLEQISELQASFKKDKEERETLMQLSKNQLANLENQMHLLQEKGWFKERELEAEHHKLVNTNSENFILQRCLHDMMEKCMILLDTCQKNLETLSCKEKLISELGKERFELKQSFMALAEDNDKLLEVLHQVTKMLNINDNGPHCYLHFELILHKIKDLMASLSDAQDDKQQLIIEKSIIVTFLEQSKVDMTNLVLEKNGIEREFGVKCEEFSVLQTEKQDLLVINELLRKDVQACNQREEGLNAEMKMVCRKLADLQGEISKLLEENQSLSIKLYNLHLEKNTLEEEITVLLQEVIAKEYLSLTFRSYNAERAVDLQMLFNDLDQEIRSLNVKLEELEIENINLKESVTELEEDVNTTRTVCGQLNTQVETGRKLVVQKDTELLQATHNIQVLQDKNSELCRNLEQFMVSIDLAKEVREELEQKIFVLSNDKVDSDNEISFLRQANDTLCRELDQLHREVQELKNNEKHLVSELQSGIDEAMLCEEEITTLLNDSQMTAINAAVYEEKMLELLLTCESLEVSATAQREKLYDEVTLKNVFKDELNKKLEALVGENRGLKEELSAYMPLVLALRDDIASLEECILLPTKGRSINHRQRQDYTLLSLQHEKYLGERNAVHRATSDVTLELQKLHVKVNALQSVFMDSMHHLEQEKSISDANLQDAMRKTDGSKSKRNVSREECEVNKDIVLHLKKKEELGNLQNGDAEKPKENNDHTVKDIQLDHVLSTLRYDDGASSHAPSTTESAETKFEIMELWDTVDSNSKKPATLDRDLEYQQIEVVEENTPMSEKQFSFEKLRLPKIITRSQRDWSGNLSERLSSDGQRLSVLQRSVKELQRNIDTSQLNESPRGSEFEKIKAQLKEVEKAILHLTSLNSKLTRKADGLGSEQSDEFGNTSERRERKVSERARRGSEKIGRLELELQKIQYILLKLKEDDDIKRARAAERRTRVVLRDYLYGRRDTPRRKKVHCCACVRPKTKD